MQVCGAQHDLKLLNMFPYAPHLAFWMVHYGATAFGLFCLGTGGGKVLGTDGNLRLIQKVKPDVLIGMPTFIYHVLQQALEHGMRCEHIRKLVLGGEKVAEGIRRKLRNMAHKLGAPDVEVIATYGFTEAKMAWAECPCPVDEQPSGYHLYPDLGIFEVVNPKTGVVMPEGNPGELVFTPLDARGSVVLRYRTGDYIDGGLFYEPCPYCKRTAPRLVGRISRSSEFKSMQLDKFKGTLIDFNELEHVLDDAPNVGAWQLELRKHNDDPMELDELTLHVTWCMKKMRTPPAQSSAVNAAPTPPPRSHPSPNGTAKETTHHKGKSALTLTTSRSTRRSAAWRDHDVRWPVNSQPTWACHKPRSWPPAPLP
jgi:phenylacetate-coenzyme A ligase PaaK-like adenylate-forming protein